MKVEDPSTSWSGWIAPGGGIANSESHHQGLLRELREELDFEGAKVGPEIWRRFHAFFWDDRKIEQHESYYLLEIERFEPGKGAAMEASEKRAFKQFRWWSIKDIVESNETFVPRDLGALLSSLRRDGAPSSPLQVGV